MLQTYCWDLLRDVEPLIMMGNLTHYGTRVMMTSAASGCCHQLLDTIAAYLHNAGWHYRMTDAIAACYLDLVRGFGQFLFNLKQQQQQHYRRHQHQEQQ